MDGSQKDEVPVPQCLTELKCYSPLKTFEALLEYESSAENFTELGYVPLSQSFSTIKMTLSGNRIIETDCPKTIVCHDMMGGYGDDRFVAGTQNSENYIFRHWLQTDYFVYFSHHFVTIPPLGWINSGHLHGVKVLGTIITEGDEGKELCKKILKDEHSINTCIDKLCLLNKNYGFDGFLVNIENQIEDTSKLLEFVKKLTTELKKQSNSNFVFWYDSVITDGKLKWQDELNASNKSFFDVCDGIYLNYGWNDEKLKNSVISAGERKFDVFVGIDIFGRGCFGGGGLNTYKAVEKIAEFNLSIAIFAPGWTFECHPYGQFCDVDNQLWARCAKHFYFRCLKDEMIPTQQKPGVNGSSTVTMAKASEREKKFQVIFLSDFCRGFGEKTFTFGKEPNNQTWFNLCKQSLQPFLICDPELSQNGEGDEKDSPKCKKLIFDTVNGFSGGGCLQISNKKSSPDFTNPQTSSPIWIPLDISISARRLTIAVAAAWKSVSVEDQLAIYLELAKPDLAPRKILLGSLDYLATSIQGRHFIQIKLSQFLNIYQSKSTNFGNTDVEFYFQKNSYDEKEVNGWRISCYLFDVDQYYDDYSNINSIRVGAEGEISIGFISLAQIIHYH